MLSCERQLFIYLIIFFYFFIFFMKTLSLDLEAVEGASCFLLKVHEVGCEESGRFIYLTSFWLP